MTVKFLAYPQDRGLAVIMDDVTVITGKPLRVDPQKGYELVDGNDVDLYLCSQHGIVMEAV